MEQKLEVWQRGPLTGIPQLLQPVAHALLQAREELEELETEFTNEILWERPAGVASAGLSFTAFIRSVRQSIYLCPK